MSKAKIGAVFFVLWGILHIVGGGAIIAAAAESPAQGFAIYERSSADYTELAGAILSYFAYGLGWIGVLVTYIAVRYNWHNSANGLALNTVLVGLTDLGLIIFLVWPGFLSWGDASPGLVLFAGGVVFGGLACSAAHTEAGPAS